MQFNQIVSRYIIHLNLRLLQLALSKVGKQEILSRIKQPFQGLLEHSHKKSIIPLKENFQIS